MFFIEEHGSPGLISLADVSKKDVFLSKYRLLISSVKDSQVPIKNLIRKVGSFFSGKYFSPKQTWIRAFQSMAKDGLIKESHTIY